MSFIAPILPRLAPYAGPAVYGALAGLGLAVADKFDKKSNFFETLARNLVIGGLSPLAGIGLANLASWTFTLLVPESVQAALVTATMAFLGKTTAAFLALPVAAQIGLPTVVAALIIGAIGIAVLNKNQAVKASELSNSSSSEEVPPAPPAPLTVV